MAPVVVLHLLRMPARRPLEDVRRAIAGGWDEPDVATVEDGLTVADRIQVAAERMPACQVLQFVLKHP